MIVIDHGQWALYTPSVPNPNAPANTIYARRNSDRVDWYDFMLNNFQSDTVKMMCLFQLGEWIVSSAVFVGDRLFPAGQLVLEVQDYLGTDPAADFNGKVYDPITQTFREFVPPTLRNVQAA